MEILNLSKIKNADLLKNFFDVVKKERSVTTEVITYIAELYKRRLYAELGYSSLFSFLTEKYDYSKSAAYRRIQAAKVFLLFLCLLRQHLNLKKKELEE